MKLDKLATYISTKHNQTNDTMFDYVKQMNEDELRRFLLVYIDLKSAYDKKLLKTLYNTNDVSLLEKVANMTNDLTADINNVFYKMSSLEEEPRLR